MAVYFILNEFGRGVGMVEEAVGNGNECVSSCVERVLDDSESRKRGIQVVLYIAFVSRTQVAALVADHLPVEIGEPSGLDR